MKFEKFHGSMFASLWTAYSNHCVHFCSSVCDTEWINLRRDFHYIWYFTVLPKCVNTSWL